MEAIEVITLLLSGFTLGLITAGFMQILLDKKADS